MAKGAAVCLQIDTSPYFRPVLLTTHSSSSCHGASGPFLDRNTRCTRGKIALVSTTLKIESISILASASARFSLPHKCVILNYSWQIYLRIRWTVR